MPLKHLVFQRCISNLLYRHVLNRLLHSVPIDPFLFLAACRASGKPSMETKSMKYSSHGSIADIILIIRDSFHSKKAVRNLKYVLRQLDNHLENFDIDAR